MILRNIRHRWNKHWRMSLCRSSRPEVLLKKGVLRNFAKFTGKHLCQSLFIKKETLAQMFSCQFRNISKNTFYYKQLRWLLLCLTDFADGYSQETNTCSKSSNINSRKNRGICSKIIIPPPITSVTSLFCVCIWLWIYFTPFLAFL